MEFNRATYVMEVRAARAKERRLATLRRLSGKKTHARKVVTEGRNTESLKGSEQNQSFRYNAPQTSDSENEDEQQTEISKIDWVPEWLDKHCFLDEQAWGAIMAGVEATPEEMENQLQDKPNPPVGNFKLDSNEYTSLDNTCPKKFLAALTRLNQLQKSHDHILAQLTFPNKMVVQHVTYIVKTFLRRMYFRMKGKSHNKQEAMMRKMHYAMQGIVHRYFKRGMDKKVYLHKAAEKDEFENWSDDEDDEEGRSDDDEKEEGSVNETQGEESDEVQENEQKRSNNEDENQKRKMDIQEIKMVKRFVSSAVTLHAQAPEEAIYSGKVTVEHVLKHPQTLTHQNDRVEGSVPGMEGQDGNSGNEEDDEDEYYIPDDKSYASLEFSDNERMHCHLSDVEDDEGETDDASWDEEDDSDAESETRLSPTEYPSDGEESNSSEDGECGGEGDETIAKKSKTSPGQEVNFRLLNRLAGEFSDGSEEEGDEKAAWRRSQDVSHTLWMQEMVSDCPLKDRIYSQEFHCCRAPLFPKVNLSTHSSQDKEKVLQHFMKKNVSRNICRYVMKTVCRRNFAIFKMVWRRAKGLKRFPGLRLGTQDTAAWQSFKRQKAYLNDFLMTEKEALLYSLSRKHKVSCEEIFQAQATVEMLLKKRRLAVKIVKFLDQLPIRRLEYLNDHILAKAQRENGGEPQSHSDMTSVLLFLETVATMQGQESLFPCRGNVCEKLQGYVESLVHGIDNEYKFFCKEKEKRVRREEIKVKLNNMSKNTLTKYLSVAKETYQSLTRKFLQQKHKYLKRRLSEHELNSLFPLCPKDDIGLMHLPKHQRLHLLTHHNNKQLKLRRDYINMVKEKARHTKRVLAKMNRFLSRSSAQDIILKVYDIKMQESEWAQRSMVLEDEAITYLELSPQEYKESTKYSLTGLTWDTWSDDEQDNDSDWMDEGSEEGEEEIWNEEQIKRKAAEEGEAKIEPLTVQKIFREMHVQYYPTGKYILKNQRHVQESHPTSFPFEQKPWETPVHHAILDKFVKYLSNNKSQTGRPLKIDFQKEIHRLWHYKPKGFTKTIRCYENLRKTYNKEQRRTLRAWRVTKADEDQEHLKHHEFKVSSECEGETQATPTKEKENTISMKRKFQINEDITPEFQAAESKKIKLDDDEDETKEMDTGKTMKRKITESEQVKQVNKEIKNGGYDKTVNTDCTSTEDGEHKKSVKRRFLEEWDVTEHPKDKLKEVQNKKQSVWREEKVTNWEVKKFERSEDTEG